jgi:putative ubiquitin-RnfH superfamily antitoxin RatB of RatAB toxin-antitoxin module
MISITIAYATSERQIEIPLSVEESCTLAIAIKRSGILQLFPDIKLGRAQTGIFGKKIALDDIVKNGDRVEIYRPLRMDPKQARLARAKAKCTR